MVFFLLLNCLGSLGSRDWDSLRHGDRQSKDSHFGKDVAYNSTLVIFSNKRELWPGEDVVHV